MFEDNTTRKPKFPHSIESGDKSNDMSDFGNNGRTVDSVSTFSTDGIGFGNDSVGNADSGIGDGCGNASDAGCGMSM